MIVASFVHQVELLVMKALSLGLVTCHIDEVEQRVHMTWVQPRVLDLEQVCPCGKYQLCVLDLDQVWPCGKCQLSVSFTVIRYICEVKTNFVSLTLIRYVCRVKTNSVLDLDEVCLW